MPVSKKEISPCPIDAMLSVVDGRWKGTILWRLSNGPMRTSELRRSIPEMTERMLIRHLQELVRDGILVRHDERSGAAVRAVLDFEVWMDAGAGAGGDLHVGARAFEAGGGGAGLRCVVGDGEADWVGWVPGRRLYCRSLRNVSSLAREETTLERLFGGFATDPSARGAAMAQAARFATGVPPLRAGIPGTPLEKSRRRFGRDDSRFLLPVTPENLESRAGGNNA